VAGSSTYIYITLYIINVVRDGKTSGPIDLWPRDTHTHLYVYNIIYIYNAYGHTVHAHNIYIYMSNRDSSDVYNVHYTDTLPIYVLAYYHIIVRV